MEIELRVVQFWTEIKRVITNRDVTLSNITNIINPIHRGPAHAGPLWIPA